MARREQACFAKIMRPRVASQDASSLRSLPASQGLDFLADPRLGREGRSVARASSTIRALDWQR